MTTTPSGALGRPGRPAASRTRALVAAPLAALTALAACSTGAGDDPGVRAATATPTSATASSPPAASASPSPTATTATPLVVAVHPTRQGLDLTAADVAAIESGEVTTWAALDADGGTLQVGTQRDVRADRDAVALVPASSVGPAVTAAEVDGVDPLRDPEAYPLQTAGPAPGAVTTVTVTGDLMLGRRVGARLAAAGDPAAALRPLAPRLAGADLTIGNLESTLSQAGAPRQGGDSFGADPSVRQGLRLAGFDVLSLANNHVGDFGPTALRRTVSRVRDGGFLPVGAGRNMSVAAEPAVVERNGVTFGVLAFDAIGETPAATDSSPGAFRLRMQPRTGPLNDADLARVLDAVEQLAAQVDVVVVVPHWGTQYTHATVRDQRRVARALVDAGADVVAGGHPHWVQGVETRRGSLVAYSLGNFVFDMDFMRKTQEGVLLELVFWGDELKGSRLVPYVIGGDFAPRRARGQRAAAILRDVWRASDAPLRGSHALTD